MIYVLSEDHYFCLGIMSTLRNSGKDAIMATHDAFSSMIHCINNDDIILLCAQSKIYSLALNSLARMTLAKVFFFIDTAAEIIILKHHHVRVMSKKSTQEELVKLIKNLGNEVPTYGVSLSRQQTVVMDLLVKNYNAYHIAKLLHLSEKTVFAHKMNALRKLKLNHINALSIVLYERVFQTRV